MEGIFCTIFEQVLGIERVSATGDFFELGGHSVMAMKVVNLIKARGENIHCTVAHLFRGRTAAMISKLVEKDSAHVNVIPEPERSAYRKHPFVFARAIMGKRPAARG